MVFANLVDDRPRSDSIRSGGALPGASYKRTDKSQTNQKQTQKLTTTNPTPH